MTESFGKYELIEKIAQGGMAEVFRATLAGEIGGFTRRVAIKRVFPHLVDREEIINMFIDEARIAARLHHPNIVQIYDLGVEDSSFFIAMEYVEGIDLRRLCELGITKRQFLPRYLAAYVVAEAAAGLHYAHTRDDEDGRPMRIVHRDVSPQNVLVSIDGAVKICDFGIARAESRLSDTRAGEFKGKFSYMSPEQFGRGVLDHRSDIFTLGIVLYEVTVATRLFKSRTEYETMRRITEGDFRRPSEVRADFPAELERIILKALDVDQARRYQSAAEMQHDLEEWLFEERARVGNRQLASYLKDVWDEEFLQGQVKPPADFDGLKGLEKERSQGSVVAREEVVGEVEEVEEDPTAIVTISDRKLQNGREQASPAVEIRRISPDEARKRRARAPVPADSMDETLVDYRSSQEERTEPFGEAEFEDITLQDLDEEFEPELQLATSAGVLDAEPTKERRGQEAGVEEYEESEDDPESRGGLEGEVGRREWAVDAQDEEGPSTDSLIRHLPDLRPGGRALTGRYREEGPGGEAGVMAPTIAIKPVQRTMDIPRKRGGRGQVIPVVMGVAIAMIGGILLATFWPLQWGSQSGTLAREGKEDEGQTVGLTMMDEVRLRIRSTPEDGFVIVNGVLQEGTTPLDVALVEGVENEVWVGKPNYRPERLLVRADGQELERDVTLERVMISETARVDFRSIPEGAKIYLNGSEVGTTPMRMENVGADFPVHVQYELAGYGRHVALTHLRTQSGNRIEAVLVPEASQEVRGSYQFGPRGSRVSVGGEFLATTPFEEGHQRGQWLELEVDGHERKTARHRLRLDEIGSFEFGLELEPLRVPQGLISLELGTEAAVYLQGKLLTSLEDVELPAGEQVVIVETIDGERLRGELMVEEARHRQYRLRVGENGLAIEER